MIIRSSWCKQKEMNKNVSAITNIDGENFRLLSLEQVFLLEEKEIRWSATAMKRFLRPLSEQEGFNEAQIKSVEWEVKHSGLKLFEMKKREFYMLNFENREKKRYSVYFHKVKPVIFAFLLSPLSDAEMEKIKKNSKGSFVFDDEFIRKELKKRGKELNQEMGKKKYTVH